MTYCLEGEKVGRAVPSAPYLHVFGNRVLLLPKSVKTFLRPLLIEKDQFLFAVYLCHDATSLREHREHFFLGDVRPGVRSVARAVLTSQHMRTQIRAGRVW